MEILINELSLHGQFATADIFISTALKPLLSLLQQYDSNRDLLLKKYDLWAANVTPTISLRDIFKGSYSRTNDEIRRAKSQLANLIDNPYWEDNRRHNHPDIYKFNSINIFDSSIAESCERDKVIISFKCDQFDHKTFVVDKNSCSIIIDNLVDHTHLYNLVRARGIVVDFSLSDTSRFKKTHFNVQGKVIYKELLSKCYWYLDNLHHSHYEVFNSQEEHIGLADLNGNVDVSKRVNGRRLFD